MITVRSALISYRLTNPIKLLLQHTKKATANLLARATRLTGKRSSSSSTTRSCWSIPILPWGSRRRTSSFLKRQRKWTQKWYQTHSRRYRLISIWTSISHSLSPRNQWFKGLVSDPSLPNSRRSRIHRARGPISHRQPRKRYLDEILLSIDIRTGIRSTVLLSRTLSSTRAIRPAGSIGPIRRLLTSYRTRSRRGTHQRKRPQIRERQLFKARRRVALERTLRSRFSLFRGRNCLLRKSFQMVRLCTISKMRTH